MISTCNFRWWVDHTYSDVLGARISTNVECGSLLLTVLTFIVSLAEGGAWTILAYTLFHVFASKEKVKAFRAQLQLFLINPTNSVSDWWVLVKTGLSWRKHNRRKAARYFLFLSLVPITCFLTFGVAHIAVSKVTLPDYEGAVYPTYEGTCGTVSASPKFEDGDFAANVIVSGWALKNTRQAQAYKNQCYHQPTNDLDCSGFVVQELPYTSQTVECPWADDICAPGVAFQMDTGWLDSHIHFGINARPGDRVEMRMVSTCSVLNITNYTRTVPDTDLNGMANITEFFFGFWENTTVTITTPDGFEIPRTFYFSDVVSEYPYVPYIVVPWLWTGSQMNASNPLNIAPALLNPDGDLTLVAVSAGAIEYISRVLDPLFYADKEVHNSYLSGSGWQTRDVAKVAACFDQTQIRNPVTGDYSSLNSSSGVFNDDNVLDLGMNNAQLVSTARLLQAATWGGTFWNVLGLHSQALAADDMTFNQYSDGLPDYQWMIEAGNWFDIGLAKIQYLVSDYATNYWTTNAEQSQYLSVDDPSKKPAEFQADWANQCRTQLVRGVATRQTFSALGVGMIVVLGPLIVILSLFLGKLVRWVGSKHSKYSDLAYRKQNILRMALESRGYDGWIETHMELPVRPGDQADVPPAVFRNGHLDIPAVDNAESTHRSTIVIEGEKPMDTGNAVRTSTVTSNPPRYSDSRSGLQELSPTATYVDNFEIIPERYSRG